MNDSENHDTKPTKKRKKEKPSRGWIRLHRDIWERDIVTRHKACPAWAWVDLVLMSNHESSRTEFGGEVIEIPPGSCITSVRNLAKRWKWDRKRVQRFLRDHQRDHLVSHKWDHLKSIITILDYSKYQGEIFREGPPKGPPLVPQMGPKQIDLHIIYDLQSKIRSLLPTDLLNNKKKGDEVLNILVEWCLFRKEIKAPVTPRAIKMLLNRYPEKYDELVRDLTYSMSNGWTGVFAPNGKSSTQVKELDTDLAKESKKFLEKYGGTHDTERTR